MQRQNDDQTKHAIADTAVAKVGPWGGAWVQLQATARVGWRTVSVGRRARDGNEVAGRSAGEGATSDARAYVVHHTNVEGVSSAEKSYCIHSAWGI